MAYTKGFSDGTTLREFCDEPGNTTYFPGADSRPEVWKREMRACEP
jgi:hypothetical protein